jgi:hypothetical protein
MSRRKSDIFALKIEGTIPSREDLSNPFRNRNELDLLIEGQVIDLRDNHIVEELPNGYIRVVPIDPNKKFKK